MVNLRDEQSSPAQAPPLSHCGEPRIGASSSRSSLFTYVAVYVAILVPLYALHATLLRLPYIWDEAGYYIPAARDLWLTGSLIPHSTVSNAHPPLVLSWLALAWKIAGYSPVTTRTAMLLVAAFALLGVFRLAEQVSNREVAIASTVSVGLYSVFFTQSSLAHLDMAAAALTLWGLRSYLAQRRIGAAIWFSLAALAKETAVLAPVGLVIFELASLGSREPGQGSRQTARNIALLVLPFLPLAAWFAYHYHQTGYVFGNPEFFRYNVAATFHPLRMVLAAAMRIWQLLGYMHLWLLTLAAASAMFLPPLVVRSGPRPRIAIPVQSAFLAVIVVYIAAMAVVGGAVLARYMLPVLPLVVILCVSTLWRRVQRWRIAVAFIAIGFIAAWFMNPPYGFSFEDNLAYRDYIVLHEDAERTLSRQHPAARVLTAWPASDELTRPYLRYVSRPMHVVRIENFSLEQMITAAQARSEFDFALVFSTKYAPPTLLDRWPAWQIIKTRFFGFHRDLPPAAAAQILGGDMVYSATRAGQWIAIIEVPRLVQARVEASGPAGGRNGFSRPAKPCVRNEDEANREPPALAALAFQPHNSR